MNRKGGRIKHSQFDECEKEISSECDRGIIITITIFRIQ